MRNLPSFAAAALACVAIATACSSSTSHPPLATGGATAAGGSTSPGSGDGGTTSSSTIDGGTCLPGTFDVEIDTMLLGTNEVAGSVSFSQSVVASHQIVLTLTSTTGMPSFSQAITFPVDKDSFTFRLRSVPDGSYTLQAQADVAGTTGVSDSGDLDGYFGGTTLMPIHTRADGEIIMVPACKGGADFGIGPKV